MALPDDAFEKIVRLMKENNFGYANYVAHNNSYLKCNLYTIGFLDLSHTWRVCE